MAISRDSYGSVGTPRIFVDNVQYAKAVNEVDYYKMIGGTIQGQSSESAKQNNLWDLNPVNTIVLDQGPNDYNNEYYYLTAEVRFKNYQPVAGFDLELWENRNKEFNWLMSTTNYYGVLGHNMTEVIGTHGTPVFTCRASRQDETGAGGNVFATETYDIVSSTNGAHYAHPFGDGFCLVGFNTWDGAGGGNTGEYYDYDFHRIGIGIRNDTYVDWAHDLIHKNLEIGSFTLGTILEFPQSAQLEIEVKHSFDGLSNSETLPGEYLVNVKYLPPNWGKYKPWANTGVIEIPGETHYEDFRNVGSYARRSWTLNFSHVDKKSIFPKEYNENLAGAWISNNDEDFVSNNTDDHQNNIVGTFLSRTFGGKIPFIFQPNKNTQEFALCVLDQNSFSVNEIAHGVYDFSMTFKEAW